MVMECRQHAGGKRIRDGNDAVWNGVQAATLHCVDDVQAELVAVFKHQTFGIDEFQLRASMRARNGFFDAHLPILYGFIVE